MPLSLLDDAARLHHRGGGRFGHILGLLLLLALIGSAVYLILWLARRRRGGESRSAKSEVGSDRSAASDGSAISLLRERFARGDIDETEYLHRRSVLEGTHGTSVKPVASEPQPAESEDPTDPDDTIE